MGAGNEDPEPLPIEVPAGSCVFHSGEIWHGSGPNVTGDTTRRSIGVHMVPVDAQFSDRPGGYIYRRYQRTGDPSLDESYFPILWSKSARWPSDANNSTDLNSWVNASRAGMVHRRSGSLFFGGRRRLRFRRMSVERPDRAVVGRRTVPATADPRRVTTALR